MADHLHSLIASLPPEQQAEVVALMTDPDAQPALANLCMLQQVMLADALGEMEAADA